VRAGECTIFLHILTLTSASSFSYSLGEKDHEFSDRSSLEESKGRNILRSSELHRWLNIVTENGEGEETHGNGPSAFRFRDFVAAAEIACLQIRRTFQNAPFRCSRLVDNACASN
jgi:hypothetical protein